MNRLTSKDGTPIAYEKVGSGPAVILVGGGAVDRSENTPLAPELAERFTVYNYDRRGRGDSGDTQPYALEREMEDIEALIVAAGGSAHLYGASSGGALAMEAAAAGLAVEKIAVYEVPYSMGDEAARQWQEYVVRLTSTLADGRRGDAFALFMRIAGSSEQDIEAARSSEYWAGCEAIAPTLAYDAACLGDGRPPIARLARITQPTLVATGGSSPDSFVAGGGSFFDAAADAIAASIPQAQRRIVAGQTHMVDAKVLAPILAEFFGE
jgi:pimeloyl-ACP methyl ester carboxylesterase